MGPGSAFAPLGADLAQEASLVVRRADGANTRLGKRSVKICRPHRTASQRKRRVVRPRAAKVLSLLITRD